jgi:folate-binding protein YgfZ
MTTTPDRITDRILGPRDTVVVSGSDAQSYLQSQIAQTLDGIEVGESRWSFVLDPTGKIVSLARVTRRGDDEFVLDTDAGFGQLLLDRLNRFKLRVDAELTLDAGEPVPTHKTVERERVEAGWPRMGAEIMPDETIVGGTGLAPIAVCFTKGCYPGQELVERMDSRGAQGPKTLRRVPAPAGVSAGDPVVVDGTEVGTYTTVAGDLALAWIKRGTDHGEPIQF